MGCDGGTIPRRDELVRMKKKPEQKDKVSERSFKWRNCALTQQRLQEPIVSCGLGRLYSKSSVIEALLDKETKPDCISHIKGLKDIKDLKLTKNPAYKDTEHLEGTVDEGSAPYICTICGLEMTGKFRFIYLWSCGCVMAERALKVLKQNICHLCQTPFTDEDIVVLNGTDEDVEELKIKMANRVAGRKTKKTKVKTEQQTPSTSVTAASSTEPVPSGSTVKEEPSSTKTVVKKEEETIPLALPKYNDDYKPRGFFGSTKRAPPRDLVEDPSYKKSKKEYSVASDPKSSEVYKSLFTSHKTEKEQQRAHWVTYNPFYN